MKPHNRKLKILFLCTGNSCRSQMAEGWARALHPRRLVPYSAGIKPQGLNPRAVAAMREAGVDIAAQTSKHVDSLRHIDFDAVITVCDHANENCPTIATGAQRLHVGFDDPPRLAQGAPSDEQAMAPYRRVRDEDLRRVARDIEATLVDSGRKSVAWSDIVSLALDRLRNIDAVATNRFAANYTDETGVLRFDDKQPAADLRQLGLPLDDDEA